MKSLVSNPLRRAVKAAALLACAVAAVPAMAAPCATTYNVDLALEALNVGGAAGQLTGTICTDGTLGTLGAANIASWNLTLTGSLQTIPTYSFVSGANNARVRFLSSNFDAYSALSATASDLVFNFDLPSGLQYAIFEITQEVTVSDGNGGTFAQTQFFGWDARPANGFPSSRYYGYDNPDPVPGGGQNTPTTTSNLIGTTTPPTTVPEPGSLALLGLAGAALLAAGRRSRPR